MGSIKFAPAYTDAGEGPGGGPKGGPRGTAQEDGGGRVLRHDHRRGAQDEILSADGTRLGVEVGGVDLKAIDGRERLRRPALPQQAVVRLRQAQRRIVRK